MSDEITGKVLTYVEADVDVYRITRFEGANSGVAIADWTLTQGANTTLIGALNAALPSGRGARLQKSTSSAGVAWHWTRVPNIADVSVVALLRSQIAAEDMGILVRNTGPSAGYLLRLAGDTLEIWRGAGVTLLASMAFAAGADDSVWMRFDAATVAGPGVLLRAKVWRGALTDEPADFTLSHTDSSSPQTAAGPVGLYTNANGTDVLCGHFRAKSLLGSLTETLRFTKSTEYMPREIDAIPNLIEATLAPGTISLGQNLGERATLTVSFKDHPGADLGELFDSGSYWAKLKAREILRRGQEIRVKRGLLGQALDDFETRTYVFDSLSGPSPQGAVGLIAKDPLKLADNDRALAPRPSTGFLVADISSSAGEATLSPTGVGDLEYPATGKAAIGGKETVYFSRDPYTKLLLHFDGSDAATATVDIDVGNPHAVTFNGSAQLDTSIKKFGTASLQLGAAGNYVSLADSGDWALGTNDFTIKVHTYFATVPSGAPNTTFDNLVFWQEADANNFLYFGFDGTNVQFVCEIANVLVAHYTAAHGMSNATQHHWEIVRSGTSFFIFRDGVSLSLTAVQAIGGNSLGNIAAPLNIGGQSIAGPDRVDEFMWRNGIAEHTSGFTAPTAEYELTGTGDVIRITRAQYGSEAIDHDAEDRVQLCLDIDGMDPADIIHLLETEYASIDGGIIPLSTWQAETATYLQRVYTRLIAEPTGVNKLVSELIEQAGLVHWYDDELNQLRLQVLRGIPVDAFVYSQRNIMGGSLQTQDQPEKQITQVITWYGVRNPLEPLDQNDNYRSGIQTVDLEQETISGSPVIRQFYGTWIPAFARSTAERTNDLQIGRFVKPPRRITFDVMRYSGVEEPVPGGGYRMEWWANQDEAGETVNTPIQVTRVNPMADRLRAESEEMLFKIFDAADLINRAIIFDSNINNVDANTAHNSIYGDLTAQDIIDGVNVAITVAAGVIVGSTGSIAVPGLDLGTWPTASATGNTSNGSPIITSLSVDPTDMKVGATVTGTGIQANSKILTIDGPTQITLDKNATATATGVALTFHVYIHVFIIGRGQGRGGAGGNGAAAFPAAQPGFDGGPALFTRVPIFLTDTDGELWGGGGGGGGVSGGGGGGAGQLPGAGGGSFNPPWAGLPGTTEAGGAGSQGGGTSGNGGGPGLAGQTSSGIVGGDPGLAIDGISFVTTVGAAGDRRGGTAN